jgi:hypothetical protein
MDAIRERVDKNEALIGVAVNVRIDVLVRRLQGGCRGSCGCNVVWRLVCCRVLCLEALERQDDANALLL